MALTAQAAARGRQRAEELMTDTCRVVREGAVVWNPVTETETTTETVLHDGQCRIRPQGTQATASDVGGSALARFPYLVSVPFTVTGVGLEDVVDIVTSQDPDLVGARLRVRGVEAGTHVTARRLGCVKESR